MHISNLQRQILFTSEEIERPKYIAAHQHPQLLNSGVRIVPLAERPTVSSLKKTVSEADLLLNCSDNMDTRQVVNAAYVAANTPLITASAVGSVGQMLVLTPPWSHGWRCKNRLPCPVCGGRDAHSV